MVAGPTFEEYLAIRQGSLLRMAWLLTGDRPLAEDLVQAALVKVWPRWSKITNSGDPDAYVHKVLVNTYTSNRRRRWHGERPSGDALPDVAVPTDPYLPSTCATPCSGFCRS